MALVLVRETPGYVGKPVAAGHPGRCAAKLADEHARYGHGPAVPTNDPSRAKACDWCHRPSDYE